MLSPMPAALATACTHAEIPMLRFDWTGVAGSGGKSHYSDAADTAGNAVMPDRPEEEFQGALAFLEERCDAVAVVGMSMGACCMVPGAAASRKLVAYVSVSTGPDIGKWLYGKDPVKKAANDKLIFDAHAMLPAGVPKLFIAGSKDSDITPIPMMHAMLERVPMPRKLEAIEGMNHGAART